MRQRLRAWWPTLRPWSYTAAVIPVLLGASIAAYQGFADLWLLALPIGFLVASILHANNLRDLETDRQFGKRTLATILGREGARVEYYLLIAGTYVSLLLIVLLGFAPWWTLISLLTLPMAIRI